MQQPADLQIVLPLKKLVLVLEGERTTQAQCFEATLLRASTNVHKEQLHLLGLSWAEMNGA